MKEFFERGFLATVGMFSLSREKTQELVEDLVKKGELSREEGRQVMDQALRRGQEEQENLRKLVAQEVQKALGDLDLVTRKDIDQLNEKLDALLQKLVQA